VPGNYGCPESWKGVVPTGGTLSVDYCSRIGPPPDAEPLGDGELLEFLHAAVGGRETVNFTVYYV
jgi:hypothetical protein